jgi:hypothetical protein
VTLIPVLVLAKEVVAQGLLLAHARLLLDVPPGVKLDSLDVLVSPFEFVAVELLLPLAPDPSTEELELLELLLLVLFWGLEAGWSIINSSKFTSFKESSKRG